MAWQFAHRELYPWLLVLGVFWLIARWRGRRRQQRAGIVAGHARTNSPRLPIVNQNQKDACEATKTEAENGDASSSWGWNILRSGKAGDEEAAVKTLKLTKFGAPKSEIYKLKYYPIHEDIAALIQVAVRDASKHEEVAAKLQELKVMAADLPSSGWVQPQDPRVLLRFLLARQCSVERAFEMLSSVLAWRQQNNVADILPSQDKSRHERFDWYWKKTCVLGKDLDGDPVVLERVGQNDPQGLTQCNMDFIEQHTIYNAECVFAGLEVARRENLENGNSRGFQFTVIVDMDGVDLSFMDRQLLGMLQTVGRVESDHYPEGLKRVFVVRAPWIFPVIWRMCRPFVDQGTLDKINIVNESEITETLLSYVPQEAVPKALGGALSNGDDDYGTQAVFTCDKLPQEVIDMTSSST